MGKNSRRSSSSNAAVETDEHESRTIETQPEPEPDPIPKIEDSDEIDPFQAMKVIENEVENRKSIRKSKRKLAKESFTPEATIEATSAPSENNKEETQLPGNEENPEDVIATPSTKKRKIKDLPSGYVCHACGAVEDHAIYNCPIKISNKLDNKKKRRGEKDTVVDAPATSFPGQTGVIKAVYISGLPFSYDKEQLMALIQGQNDTTPIGITSRDITLLTFEDNPDKCKGMAYVNCHNDHDYELCLSLHGMKMGKTYVSSVPSIHPLKDRASPPATKKPPKSPRCYRCGQEHDPVTCTNPRICYRCKSTEHLSFNCPHRKAAQ